MRGMMMVGALVSWCFLTGLSFGGDGRPVVWMANGLIGVKVPPDWKIAEEAEKFRVSLQAPGFPNSRLVIAAPNLNASDKAAAYVRAYLENYCKGLDMPYEVIASDEDESFDGFDAPTVSALSPDKDSPTLFIEAQAFDFRFGGAPVILAIGPAAEKAEFMAAIKPVISSFRVDFKEVYDQEDYLQAFSDTIYAAPPDAEDDGEDDGEPAVGEAEAAGAAAQ